MSEISDLKHDIERHLAITSRQAERIAELEAALSIICRHRQVLLDAMTEDEYRAIEPVLHLCIK